MTLEVLYILPPTKTFAGIERVVDEVCSELAETYCNIKVDVLFTSSYKGAPAFRNYNKLDEIVSGRWDLLRTVRRVVARKRYDLVVVPQVEATVLFWVACFGLGRRFVLYLHGNHKRERSHYKAEILFTLMKSWVIHRLAGVFGTSPQQLDSFRKMYPSAVRHYWVPNPVRQFESVAQRPAPTSTVNFVKVGRFSYQKGHDILLGAFAKLYARRKNVRLVLVGYGLEEPRLRAQIQALGLADVVVIEHQPHNPQAALSAADVYVSASRWEGWSLAICEALRFGLPVVATDCEFGPSDILTDARLGRLAPASDEAGLAEAMLYYCDNLDAERAEADYRRAYIDRFSAANVVQAHADALLEISGRSGCQQRRQSVALSADAPLAAV
jgi:glycosyltransferase involved in cell wall biosynthesis